MISVDTKKKELVGDFKNAGREWRPQGDPEEVRVHDFLIRELGRAVPYGIYDLAANAGWVSVGMDHDTSAFAVQTIRTWWHSVGKQRYRDTRRLTITADGGGSNGSRVRLWKRELQHLAHELGIEISVHHFPPGTSKWNKCARHLAPGSVAQVVADRHGIGTGLIYTWRKQMLKRRWRGSPWWRSSPTRRRCRTELPRRRRPRSCRLRPSRHRRRHRG